MITRICLFIMLIMTAQMVSGADNLPIYSAAKVGQTPVIDGVLDEECWRTAEKTSSFTAIGGGAVSIGTRGMLCWDDENIYIAVECQEPLMDKLKGRVAQGKVWPFEETVEVFIDSDFDRVTYIQFAVHAYGGRTTSIGSDIHPDLADEWASAVSLNSDGWTVEIAIPFRFLGMMPKSAALWGLNLNRSRTNGPEAKWTCWSDTQGGFHTPSRFGRLVFQPYSSWLIDYFKGRADEKINEARAVISRYPSLVIDGERLLDNMETACLDYTFMVSEAVLTTGEQSLPLSTKGEGMIDRCEEILSDVRLSVIAGEFGHR